jgi:hypothetical protein
MCQHVHCQNIVSTCTLPQYRVNMYIATISCQHVHCHNIVSTCTLPQYRVNMYIATLSCQHVHCHNIVSTCTLPQYRVNMAQILHLISFHPALSDRIFKSWYRANHRVGSNSGSQGIQSTVLKSNTLTILEHLSL